MLERQIANLRKKAENRKMRAYDRHNPANPNYADTVRTEILHITWRFDSLINSLTN